MRQKHLYISKTTGAFHCFSSGCDFKGKLKDFWEERPGYDPSFTGTAGDKFMGTHCPARNIRQERESENDSGKATSEVPMIPEDYKNYLPKYSPKSNL